MLSRKQMEAEIAMGRSILFPNGRVATKVEHLPSEAELALHTDDEGQKAAAAAAIAAQIEALQRQHSLLVTSPKRPIVAEGVTTPTPTDDNPDDDQPPATEVKPDKPPKTTATPTTGATTPKTD
jgi:hypothetical protein